MTDDLMADEDDRSISVEMPSSAKKTPPPKKLTLDESYKAWKEKPSPRAMGLVLESAAPVLSSAIKSYGSGNQALQSHARRLAADAIMTYDPNRGAKLQTHIMSRLQPLQRHHREVTRMARIPERVSMDLYRMSQAVADFSAENQREPSDGELSRLTHMPIRRLNKVRKYANGDVSESMFTENEDGDEGIMYPGTDKPNPDAIWLEYVHHDLNPIDQQILEWKTGYNGKPILSNNDIARKLKLSAGAVSQRSAKISEMVAQGHDLGDQL